METQKNIALLANETSENATAEKLGKQTR